MTSLTPENYIFKFGLYNNMKAIDILKIKKVNPKTGKTDNVGKKYLEFICKQDWFRHKSIIEQLLKTDEEGETTKE